MQPLLFIYEYNVFGHRPLSKLGLFLWKKALKHSKEYFVSSCLKQDRVSLKRVFLTLELEKAFRFRGLRPLTLTRGNSPGPYRAPQKTPGFPIFRLFDFPPFPSLMIRIKFHGVGAMQVEHPDTTFEWD